MMAYQWLAVKTCQRRAERRPHVYWVIETEKCGCEFNTGCQSWHRSDTVTGSPVPCQTSRKKLQINSVLSKPRQPLCPQSFGRNSFTIPKPWSLFFLMSIVECIYVPSARKLLYLWFRCFLNTLSPLRCGYEAWNLFLLSLVSTGTTFSSSYFPSKGFFFSVIAWLFQ